MIYIEEIKSKKMPTDTSLIVSFNYNADIVATLKQISPTFYDKKNKTWEVPNIYLSYLLDELCIYDDIDLSLLKSKKPTSKPNENIKLSRYKVSLFPHQEEAIKFGLTHDKWLLLDQMGLGKTLDMICLAQEIKKRDNIKHCLIICGVNALKSNWKAEIQKYSDLSCTILGEKINSKGKVVFGGIPDRLKQLQKGIKEFFIITNIETLRDKNVLKELNKLHYDMVVLDEAHKIKDVSSQQGKALLKLKGAKYKIALTGTPIVNSPLDAYAPLKWIEQETANASTYKAFYCTFGGYGNHEIVGYRNLNVLKNKLECCSLRRTKDILNLPEKVIVNQIVDMNDTHRKFYDSIVDGVISEVDKVRMDYVTTLGLITRLRQATACPSILTTANIKSSKIERALDIIDEVVSGGNKVVVFSTYKQTLKEIERLCSHKALVCTGDCSDVEIRHNIELFQNESEPKVLLATWQKCGTGLTMTAANYEIFIDTPYTAAEYEQAQDRCHRIGQKETLTVYNLICRDTIDERVREIVEDKSAIGDYIVDNKITESGAKSLAKWITELG